MKTYTVKETKKEEYEDATEADLTWEVHLNETDANASAADLNKTYEKIFVEVQVDTVTNLKNQIVTIRRSDGEVFPYLAPSRRIQREVRRTIRGIVTKDGRTTGIAQVDGYEVEAIYKKRGYTLYLDSATISAIGVWEVFNILGTPEWDQDCKFPTQVDEALDEAEVLVDDDDTVAVAEAIEAAEDQSGKENEMNKWDTVAERISEENPKIRITKSQFDFLADGMVVTGSAGENMDGSDWTPGAALIQKELSGSARATDLTLTFYIWDWIDGLVDRCRDGLDRDAGVRSEFDKAQRLIKKMEAALDKDGRTIQDVRSREQTIVADVEVSIVETYVDDVLPTVDEILDEEAQMIQDVPDQGIIDEVSADLMTKSDEMDDQDLITYLSAEVIKARSALKTILETAPFGSVPGDLEDPDQDPVSWKLVAAELQKDVVGLRYDRDNWKLTAEMLAAKYAPGEAVDEAAQDKIEDALVGARLDADEHILGSGDPTKPYRRRACLFCGLVVLEDDGLFYNNGAEFFCSEAHGDQYQIARI